MNAMRFLVLLMVVAVSLGLGVFGQHWLNIAVSLDLWGYWVVAVLIGIWLFFTVTILRAKIRSFWDWLGWKGMAWVLVSGLFLISREPTEFKIVMDEPMLVAMSQGMHVQRSTTMPVRSYVISGVKEYWGGFQDKRPLLFPFILSAVHDVTGYRVENVFWLNKALVFGLLIFAWLLGRRLDTKMGGEFMMLWLCGWPILAQNACGGGFEILNLLLVMLVFAAAWQFLSRSDYDTEAFLLCSCLLLAHTRYESVLYLLVFAGIWLVRSMANRRWSLSWFTAISPLFLVPVLWQRKIVSAYDTTVAWQFRNGDDHAFGIDYIYSNLQHAFRFLLVPNAELAGSALFGAFGLLAFVGLAICALQVIVRKDKMSPDIKALCWVVACVLLGFGVLLSYHWGQLDDPVATRLALPMIGVMGLAGCAIRPLLLPTVPAGHIMMGILALWTVGYSLPSMSQHRYSQRNIHNAIYQWSSDEIAHTGSRSPLIITYQERLWTIYGKHAFGLKEAAGRLPQIDFHRMVKTFDDVFLIQQFIYDPSTLQMIPLRGNRFVDGVELETVAERTFYPFNVTRISRVKAIDLDRAKKDQLPQEQFEVFRNASPTELKAWRDLLP